MSHKSNYDTIKSMLNDSYTRVNTNSIPKKADLTFGNKIKKIKHAVVFYVDMRGSRKIINDSTDFVSVKVHRSFLQAITYCVENRDGHFRSFNGDGALAFFVGENAASRAVKAAMDLDAYVVEINELIKDKLDKKVNFGIGIAQGPVTVAKSGKKGDDSTKQDLIWIGLPVYMAVELSDLGNSPKNLWISSNVRSAIGKQNHLGVVYDEDGNSMWSSVTKTFKSVGQKKVRYTKHRSAIDFR